jgi:hypothetical protein
VYVPETQADAVHPAVPELERIVPLPSPDLVSVRVKDFTVKIAVTFVAAVISTTQDPVPEHPPPLQPVKSEDTFGVAVSVTWVPCSNASAQSLPQLMPVGEEVMVPVPVPALVWVSA